MDHNRLQTWTNESGSKVQSEFLRYKLESQLSFLYLLGYTCSGPELMSADLEYSQNY